MSEVNDRGLGRPLNEIDTRVEETFSEVLAYTHGMGLVQGDRVTELQSDFVSMISAIPLYLMFNRNTLAVIEKEIISSGTVRDFVFTLHSRFITIMRIRDKKFNIQELLSALETSVLNNVKLDTDTEINKTLVKNLTDAIIPSGNIVREYLNKNQWFSSVLLLNVFSIASLKVMDDIKRPPVKN